jgi:hypothetical protein
MRELAIDLICKKLGTLNVWRRNSGTITQANRKTPANSNPPTSHVCRLIDVTMPGCEIPAGLSFVADVAAAAARTVLFRRPPPADFPRPEPTKRLPLEQAKLLHLLIPRWILAPKLQQALPLVECSLPPQQARLAQKREAVQLLPRLWFPSQQANSPEPKKPVIRPSIPLLVCLQQQRCQE